MNKICMKINKICIKMNTICTKMNKIRIKMKKMYGKEVRGIERSTFIINKEGALIREWRGVKVDGHIPEVLAFIRSL